MVISEAAGLDSGFHIHPTMAHALAHELRRRVIAGTIKPGMHLKERQLAREFHVSKTPVRDAVRHLVNEGLVEMKPQRGAYVRDFTLRDMIELSQIREGIEGIAFAAFAPLVTEEDLSLLRA